MQNIFRSKTYFEDVVDVGKIEQIWKKRVKEGQFLIKFSMDSGKTYNLEYPDSIEGKRLRDKEYEEIIEMKSKLEKKEEGTNMMDSIKGYYKKHEDILFPLLIVIILDHFFNNGGLREKIGDTAQGLLNGIQDKLLPAKKEDDKNE